MQKGTKLLTPPLHCLPQLVTTTSLPQTPITVYTSALPKPDFSLGKWLQWRFASKQPHRILSKQEACSPLSLGCRSYINRISASPISPFAKYFQWQAKSTMQWKVKISWAPELKIERRLSRFTKKSPSLVLPQKTGTILKFSERLPTQSKKLIF